MDRATQKVMMDHGRRLNSGIYKIRDKDGKTVPFRFNWMQAELFERIWYKMLILKARQLGASTLIDLMALDSALFSDGYAAGVIAHDRESAEKLFDRHIRFPYEHLPESIRTLRPADRSTTHMLRFPNESSIRVATSMRSDVLQFLHVSEFGKICAKWPEKAREVVTGSLQAVAAGNLAVIESTAEGASGYFYEYCQRALDAQAAGAKLSAQDWRLFFYPWWREPTYRLDHRTVTMTREDERYFESVEAKIGQPLELDQRAWYVAKRREIELGALTNNGSVPDMMREYPATPEEAFYAAVQGAYYQTQIEQARRDGRITQLGIEAGVPVNTFWDIGIDDFTAIWLHQRVGLNNVFLGYMEGFGLDLTEWYNQLEEWRHRHRVAWGAHYLPHDAEKRDPKDGQTYSMVAQRLGLSPIYIVQTPDLIGGIAQVRAIFGSCWFDAVECAEGLKRLGAYRRKYSESQGVWLETPMHDEASHCADAFRYFAQGYAPYRGLKQQVPKRRRRERGRPMAVA